MIVVALGSDEGEGADGVAAEPFGGSFDGVDAVGPDESCCDVS